MNKIYIKKNTESIKFLKEILKKEYNIENIDLDYNEFGKPFLKNGELYFNISNKKDLTVLAISNREIGIDIEYFIYNEILAKKICTEEELMLLENTQDKEFYFTKIWVIKESYIKMLGLSIREDFKKINSLELESKMEFIITDEFIISCANKEKF